MQMEKGKAYTRREIASMLGGGIQEYLPHVNGRVVCACLKQSMNPEIPDTILVGSGINVVRYARVFARQKDFVPVFIKRYINEWIYAGDYCVRSLSEDKEEVNRLAREALRENVVMILRLERKD